MKNIEYFSMSPGAMFHSSWYRENRPILEWYYHIDVFIEYVEHGCKQGFFNKLLYGKLPPVIPLVRYGTEYDWRSLEDLEYAQFKGCIIDIHCEGKKEPATKQVRELFDDIVERCPSDNVVVFGYDLKIVDGMIELEAIPCGPKFKDIYDMSIYCGFAGY